MHGCEINGLTCDRNSCGNRWSHSMEVGKMQVAVAKKKKVLKWIESHLDEIYP